MDRIAFTMVEVLAATILSALLSVAVLGVIAGMSNQKKALEATAKGLAWKRNFVEQLRWELAQSDSILINNNSLGISGQVRRNPDLGNPTHELATAYYQITSIAGQKWLIRDELKAGSPNERSLVACSIEGLSCAQIDANGEELTIEASGDSPDWMPIPGEVVIRIYLTDHKSKPLEIHSIRF